MVQSVSGPPPAPIVYSAAAVAPVPTPVSAPNPSTSSVPSVTDAAKASPATAAPTPTPPTPLEPTKVVVEPGANKTVLVFKLLDRATGTVLSEIPNQSPQEAAGNPGYKSGALLNQEV
jgi:hypothetical protein